MSSLVSSRFGAIRATSRHGLCLGVGAKNKIPVTDLDLQRQRSFLIGLSSFSSPANLVLFAMRCYLLIWLRTSAKCDKNQPTSPPAREKLQQLAPYPASCGLLCSLDRFSSHRGGVWSTIDDRQLRVVFTCHVNRDILTQIYLGSRLKRIPQTRSYSPNDGRA